VEKYCTLGQATDDSIIRRMRFAFWLTKAKDINSEYVILWEDNIIQDIIQDIRHLKIKNWTACVQDRTEWRKVVEKAENPLKEVKRLMMMMMMMMICNTHCLSTATMVTRRRLNITLYVH
jgi:hypothetical protein